MIANKTQYIVNRSGALRGTVSVPGDKSISHRSVMFNGLLAEGQGRIKNWLRAGDTLATLGAVRALGIDVEEIGLHELLVKAGTPQAPAAPLDLVNAGTGIRLLSGIMAGMPFESVLDGSEQLRRRPMKRIITPLSMMGANVQAINNRAPMTFRPSQLNGIKYDMPVASAQTKSAVLLAGLYANGATAVKEPGPTRDHTENILTAMGADVHREGDLVVVKPGQPLSAVDLTVPGDISSAAFLLVAAALVPDSDLTLTGVNLNMTRTGILDVLREMDADITATETGLEAGEPVGDIQVRASALKGVEVGGETVVRMIDEFPVLMVAALHAEGQTVVRDARELRVKETDRLAVMTAELRKLGAEIEETEDGFVIIGPQQLQGGVVHSHDDHRVAMSLSIAGLLAEGPVTIHEANCANDSFPGFGELLRSVGASLSEQPMLE